MWYYSINDTQQGPVDEAAIPQLLASGTIHPASLVWCAGMANWLPLNKSDLSHLVVPSGVQSPNLASPPYPPILQQPQFLNPYLPPTAAADIPSHQYRAAPLTWGQTFWSFEGRIPRRTYWAATGIWIAIFVVCGAAVSTAASTSDSHIETFLPIVFLIAMVPCIWSHFAIQVKRWHDRGKSGAMVLINLIPYIGGIWTFVECGCLRGSVGHNQYGHDPT